MNKKIIQELIAGGYQVIPPDTRIKDQYTVYNLLKKYSKKKQEQVILVSLDNKNSVLAVDVIFVGTVNSCQFSPREIYLQALKRGAVNFIIAHNHPSGSLEASISDLEATTKIIKSGRILGIECLDHLILSGGGFTSLRSNYSVLWD